MAFSKSPCIWSIILHNQPTVHWWWLIRWKQCWWQGFHDWLADAAINKTPNTKYPILGSKKENRTTFYPYFCQNLGVPGNSARPLAITTRRTFTQIPGWNAMVTWFLWFVHIFSIALQYCIASITLLAPLQRCSYSQAVQSQPSSPVPSRL